MMKQINPWKFYFLCGTPQYVLLVLKLTGVIGWSWWLVLAPVWLPIALLVLGLLTLYCLVMIGGRKKNVRRDLWQ